jgi:hypothetical protein
VDISGLGSSIAIDSGDLPHISYKNVSNQDLRYAHWTGSAWDIQVVDSPGNVGVYAAIELDANDYPHIAYMETLTLNNANLKYAKWNGTGWENETVDNAANVGYFCDIALDLNDIPHITYSDKNNDDLKYAMWNGTGWEIEVVDGLGDTLSKSSIDIDSNDIPHIAYYDSSSSEHKYAKWNVTKWDIESLDSAGEGWSISLAIDSNDYPHISYAKETSSSVYLRYKNWTGENWKTKTIESKGNDQGWEWYETAIALDSNDVPHISFYESTDDVLKYAHYGNYDEPSAPQNVEANSGDGYVNLTWEPPLDDGNSTIINYNVYRQGPPDSFFVLLEAVGNVFFYNDPDVQNDALYSYQVRAENGVGEGDWSDVVNATPNAETSIDSPVLSDPGDEDDDGVFTLEWSSVTDATSYILEEDDNSQFSSPTDIYSGSGTSHQVSGKGAGTFYYRVKAVVSSAESSWSNVESITVVISDIDDDGLPDSWEEDHFGDLNQSESDDYDDDGKTNLEEYQDGTDPTIAEPDDKEDDSSLTILLLILVVIIIIIVLMLFIILRKKKPQVPDTEN